MVNKEKVMEDVMEELKNHSQISIYDLHRILQKKFSYSYGTVIRVVDILESSGKIITERKKAEDSKRIKRIIKGGK